MVIGCAGAVCLGQTGTAASSSAKPAAKSAAAKTGAAKAQSGAPVAARAKEPSGVVDWSKVRATAELPKLQQGTLGPEQLEAFQQMLLDRAEADGWGCEDDVPPNDWLKDLTYWELPLGDVPAYLVVAGNTCGRSGKDSPNAALWIVAFHGAQPVLFGEPQEGLNGELYSVQAATTRGMPDVVVTWVVGPGEADLTYLRYDGTVYLSVAGAKLWTKPGEAARIEPVKMPAER